MQIDAECKFTFLIETKSNIYINLIICKTVNYDSHH